MENTAAAKKEIEPESKEVSNGMETTKKPENSREEKRDRSRDRSRSPRKVVSKDTSSTDPESVRCRMFIGNLNTEKLGRQDLEKQFSKYGKVIGCSIHSNFGFVQFSNREDADKAVLETHGSVIFGKRVDANIASERRRPLGKGKKRDVSPNVRDGGRMGRREAYAEPSGRFRSRSPVSRYEDFYDRGDPIRGGRVSPRDFRRSDDYGPRGGHGSRVVDPYARDAPRAKDATDCEIIATSPDVRTYGETIESRLQAMGIKARLMFPPGDISIMSIIDRLARGGCLYAVVISNQNEFHRSCTLNILHGAPQEHRNMPLDDALAFVARNFNHYLIDQRDRTALPWTAPKAFSGRDEFAGKTILTQDSYISGLLNMAAAGKPLKVVEVNHLIEAFIKYKNEIDAGQASSDKPSSSQHPAYGVSERKPVSVYEPSERKTLSAYESSDRKSVPAYDPTDHKTINYDHTDRKAITYDAPDRKTLSYEPTERKTVTVYDKAYSTAASSYQYGTTSSSSLSSSNPYAAYYSYGGSAAASSGSAAASSYPSTGREAAYQTGATVYSYTS